MLIQMYFYLINWYVWGRYDILVLPPSFAYGCTENPDLIFVTPTVLTGDKSLADVIAHETQFSSHLGWSVLIDCQSQRPNNPHSVVDLKVVDPESAFSRVPYAKGSNFLYF
ncbi:unnamed protein product [Allacma fusca]|uniref:Uncharacterized protein n=1 Tax=Allacma fusca TaxID=39272 RepID=A0A8J2K9W0_9HEXA|nr:unnamed protein product [Allacma fusca]